MIRILQLVLWLGSPLCSAQVICIPDPIESSSAEGTVYFGSEKNVLPGVKIEITKYSYQGPVIATTVTNSDGQFTLPGLRRGRYLLRARHPVVGGLDVEFRLRPSRLWHHSVRKHIVFVINTDPTKGACWGNYVKALTP